MVLSASACTSASSVRVAGVPGIDDGADLVADVSRIVAVEFLRKKGKRRGVVTVELDCVGGSGGVGTLSGEEWLFWIGGAGFSIPKSFIVASRRSRSRLSSSSSSVSSLRAPGMAGVVGLSAGGERFAFAFAFALGSAFL